MLKSDQLARQVFFIVGTGRSGTTLLQAMLSSHPRIGIPAETKFFQRWDPADLRFGGEPLASDALDAYLQAFFNSEDWQLMDLPRERVEAAMRESDGSARNLFLALLRVYEAESGKERIGEKSPLHCRKVDRIRAILPEAKFIHIYRDPRDVVASMLGMSWTQGTVRGLARSWFKTMREHLICLREVPDSHYTGVRLETLVARPEEELKRLCDFLGETFDPAMLAFHDREERGYAESEKWWKEQTRQPLSEQSIGRFQRDLTKRQIAQVERIVGPLLERFNYEPYLPRWLRENPAYLTLDTLDHLRGKAGRQGHQSSSAT
ncbi:MAG: sulfotransferase [Phycisphaerales bacterium]|nr:sulfotransferase [Phycisphaerales bacterium]